MDAMSVMFMSDPDEPCFWFCIDALQHPCVIVRAFDVVAIDPEIESVAICLHVSIALAVLDDSTNRKTVKRRGEGIEDNGRVDRHVYGLSCCVIVCSGLFTAIDAILLHRGRGMNQRERERESPVTSCCAVYALYIFYQAVW